MTDILTKALDFNENADVERKKCEESISYFKSRIDKLDKEQAFLDCFRALKSDRARGLFMQLQHVQGCRPYHLEGDALIHTYRVFCNMYDLLEKDHPFRDILLMTAFLHDIGKIKTGRPKNGDPGNWEYPYHSIVGASMLEEFINPNAYGFEGIKWLIFNHIKPLFWKSKGTLDVSEAPKDLRELCSLRNLALLGLCDIRGSKSEVPQKELDDFLYSIALSADWSHSRSREVKAMKDNKFLVGCECLYCNNSRDIEIPVDEFVNFIVYGKEVTSLSKDDNERIMYRYCGC